LELTMSKTTIKRTTFGLILAGLCLPISSALVAQADDVTLAAIKVEGLRRSEAMEMVSWLSDVYGPRLTGTPAIEEAGVWAMDRLRRFGVESVRAERFAFGKGWTLERFHAHMVEPQVMPLIGYPQSWSSSTDGTVTADVVRVDIRRPEDIERYRGTLGGKIVLPQPARDVHMLEEELALRMRDELLDEASRMPVPAPAATPARRESGGPLLADRVQAFYLAEGVVAILNRGSDATFVAGGPSGSNLDWPTQRVDGGTVFVGRGGPRDDEAGHVVPSATIAVEHYNRMLRILEKDIPIRVEINIQTRFHEEVQPNAFNILGELPGTDLAHEVVMLGAHFDSVHASTGATDNASGVAAMMEAMRILVAVHARPRRTIRIALWGAEEQGLLGSREYVRRHLADPETMTLQPAHGSVAAYYNLDNGAGRIRGIWLQENHSISPIFGEWISGLRELGVTTIGPRSTIGTDHISFDAVGIPGFQFMQDRLEYNSRTHHSNMDFFDRVQRDDMVQMSVVAAVFAYQTAMRDEKLPRKALPTAAGDH
jgi:carboxypeptidase Q